MISRTQFVLILIGTALQVSPAFAQSLTLTLSSNGDNEIKHVASRPLLIRVVLSNPRSMNERLSSMALKSDSDKNNQTDRTPKVPAVSLGSTSEPVSTLLQFTKTAGSQNAVETIKPHIMAEDQDAPSSMNLDSENVFRCTFGLEADAIKATTSSDIVISASVKPGATKADIRQEPLRIHLVSENELNQMEKVEADYTTSRYYILDHQFERAKEFADRLEVTVPQLAACLKAEIYLGLKDFDKASENCKRAIKLYAENSKDEGSPEPPTLLFSLLQTIETQKQSLSK